MPAASRTKRQRSSARGKSFDADARARERAESVITIGEREFHPRLKDHQVSREIRDLAVEQDRLNARIAIIERELEDEETDLSLEDREGKEDEANSLSDEAIQKSYDMIALLLVDGEGKPPPMGLLHGKLDYQDIRDLNRLLTGGGEPLEGPTPMRNSSG